MFLCLKEILFLDVALNIAATMFRFSCFQAHVQSNKTKKIVQPSGRAMVMALQDGSRNEEVSKDSSVPTRSNPSISKAQVDETMNGTEIHSNWDSVERTCRSEDLNSKCSFESEGDVHQTRPLKKSQSLESGLYKEGMLLSNCRKEHDANHAGQCQKSPNSEFQVSSGLANVGSIFSIGDRTPSDKDACDISDTPLSSELAGVSADRSSGPGYPSLKKSHSLPNIKDSELPSGEHAFKRASSISRSSDDLQALGTRQTEEFVNESDDQIRGDQERENDMGKIEESHMDSYFGDGFDSYLLSGLDISEVKTQQDPSVDCLAEFPNKDFKIKRIEDWVIGLEHCEPPPEEANAVPEPIDPMVEANTINGVTATGADHKVTPGMDAARRYISSLSANASAAQLANHGLVVIPFLSAFVSLKVLNLAGNSIVRITAGALPRGLHDLNLSRNNISTIEGLRELTRLRVLDLSYNRILRIGHGLASCSSLKELYLAGNKISEVEGLHRLLKLTILDLRFNKISTAKCLGQLAANYNSLQAISLEGNPSQKNVGDEQLKKYLQGLLPHLVYYNRQPIKVSTLKDGADRSVRLGMISYQSDRSLRSDRKTARKGSHGVIAVRKPSTSSTHARRIQAVDSPKLSRGKQGYLPPIRTKVPSQSRHHLDTPSKASVLTSQRSIPKSRSEGTLGAS